jgi:hypothetical protein
MDSNNDGVLAGDELPRRMGHHGYHRSGHHHGMKNAQPSGNAG